MIVSSDMSTELKNRLLPDGDALLLLLSEIVDDDLLMKMAAADYGWKADECFRLLKEIRSTGDIPAPIDFNLQEVLQLVRWSDPDDMERHVVRAFASAALIKAGGNPSNRDRFEGDNTNFALLLSSLVPLGTKYQEAALQLFAWRLGNHCDVEDPPFIYLAILMTSLLAWPYLESNFINEVVALLLASEEAARSDARIVRPHDPAEPGDQWLFGLTYFDACEPQWRSFAEQLGTLSTHIDDEQARRNVLLIASRLGAT